MLLCVATGGVAQTLTWNDTSQGAATGFRVYRAPATLTGTTPSCPSTLAAIATVPAPTTTYRDPDPSVAQGTAWCYGVTAFNAIAESPMTTATWVRPLSAPILTITLSLSGPGAGGSVASTPAGISVKSAGTYRVTFPAGTTVRLSAVPKTNGSRFLGWQGACTSVALDCAVVLSGDLAVAAAFRR